MPYTYIVECSDGSYYVGSTWDLARRIYEHNAGLGARYTARRKPVTVVWAGEFERMVDAFQFEKQVQGWRRDKRRALIEHRYEDLPELSRCAAFRSVTI